MSEWAIIISAASLGVAFTTAMRTTWWRGTLKMTRPTLIALVDVGEGPKVVVQSFIYATAPRGVVVQNMYVVLSRPQLTQTFGVWGFAPEGSGVQFGNGRHVGSEGVAVMHHFLLPPDGSTHDYIAGRYTLEVYASLAHQKKEDIKLFEHTFELDDSHIEALAPGYPGVTFMIDPKEKQFRPHIREPRGQLPAEQVQPMDFDGPSPMTIDAALLVELVASDGAPVVFKDDSIDVNFGVRLLNKGNVVVTTQALYIDWTIWGESFTKNGTTPIKEEFRVLGPAQQQLVPVPITLRPYDGEAPKFVRIQISGRVVASADEWGGSKNDTFGSIVWGKALDNRTPEKS